MDHRLPRFLVFCLVMSLALAPALSCSGGSAPQTIVHSDEDGIPDHLERQIGTDPEDFDTDHDGLSDYFELVELPKLRGVKPATSSGQDQSRAPGMRAAWAAASDEPAPLIAPTPGATPTPSARPATASAEGWKEIDPQKLHDSNGNGIHEANDPYGPDIEVTLDATLVGRIHSAISKKNGWDWSRTIPRAKAYNDAFVALMTDEANTPAPLVADGQRVVSPDLSDPLTESKATAAWRGVQYEAKIPVFKLDDADHGGDADGIPTGFETYGYSWDGSEFAPWGFTLSGKSSFTPPTVGFEVVGNTLTPKAPADLDYALQYFKTDPTQKSSDADPYADKLESTAANIPQNVKSPSDRPVVAAYPTIVGYMSNAKVTLVEDITTTQGKKVTKGTASASISPSDVTPKLSITGFLVGSKRPKSGAVAKGLDFIDDKAVSLAVGALTDNPGAAAGFSGVDINAKFDMTTDEWSQTTAVKTEHAADLGFDCTLENIGFASASQLTPTLDVGLGRDTVQSVSPASAVAELPAQGTHTFHVNAVPLSLDQLKSFQSGTPASMRLNQVDADVMVPVVQEGTVVYKDMGKWSPFASAIENWCARLTVDMGDGTYATYPVMAANARGTVPPVTLLDAMVWTLGVYGNGKYQHLNVPNLLPGQGSAQRVPSFGDWMFVFGTGYTQDEIDAYDSIFDVRLKAGTHVLAKAPGSKGDRPAVSWASISPPDGVLDITNASKKEVAAAVDADMAVGPVWIASSSSAATSTWTALTDPDGDGVYTAELPASWRCAAGQPQVIAQSAARWGDGSEGTGTARVVAKTTAFTGLTGTLSGTITDFPKDSTGLSKQIVCFDFDGQKAMVAKHSAWDGPPTGTDLSTWLYSTVSQHYVPTGDVIKTIDLHGFFEAYSPKSTPKWMGKDSTWFDATKNKSLTQVKAAKSKYSWDKVKSGIYEQSSEVEFEKDDTVLMQTKDGRWVKFTVSEYSYDTHFVSGAGTAKTTKKVSGKYLVYDLGQ